MGKIYFPPINGECRCEECELVSCHSRGKAQRTRREFTYTSGRCPRLPDISGRVEAEWMDAYVDSFPLVQARMLDDGSVKLFLKLPRDRNRLRILHWSKYNFWYYTITVRGEGGEAALEKVPIRMPCGGSPISVEEYMEIHHLRSCMFRCEVDGEEKGS